MRHALATLVLGPLLLAQGRRVRSAVPVLPEPEGEREGVAGSGPLLRLLVMGDSAAAGVGARAQDDALAGRLVARLGGAFQVDWRLVAFTGATTTDMLDIVRQATAEEFDVVVTSLGVNDVTGRRSLSDWRRQQHRLIDLLLNKFRARHVLLSGLPPMHRFPALPQPLRWYVGSRAKDFDRVLERIAATDPRCEHVQLSYPLTGTLAMAEDGFHPGPAIYELWATELAQRVIARRPPP